MFYLIKKNMKKSLLGVAAVCATMALASCADKEMCYEITASAENPLTGKPFAITVYDHTTKNDLKEAEERAKAQLTALGIKDDLITIKSKSVPDSNCD